VCRLRRRRARQLLVRVVLQLNLRPIRIKREVRMKLVQRLIVLAFAFAATLGTAGAAHADPPFANDPGLCQGEGGGLEPAGSPGLSLFWNLDGVIVTDPTTYPGLATSAWWVGVCNDQSVVPGPSKVGVSWNGADPTQSGVVVVD
jgi:hypothetical protein